MPAQISRHTVRKIAEEYTDPRRAGTFVAIGDSITALGDPSNQSVPDNRPHQFGQAWHANLAVLSNGRLQRAGYFATPSFTIQQVRDVHLPSVLRMQPRPEACFVFAGTNNVTGDQQAAWDALMQIVNALLNAGIRPILVALPPRNDVLATIPLVIQWNARIWDYARRTGTQVLDAYSPLVDKTTGGYTLALTSDYVHPSAVGRAQIASFNLAIPGWIDRFGVAPARLTASQADVSNLIDSDRGLFLTDSGTGLSSGWTVGASGCTYSRTQDSDGYWIQYLNRASGTSGTIGAVYRYVTAGLIPGATVELACQAFLNSTDLAAYVFADFQDSGGASLGASLQLAPLNQYIGTTLTGNLARAQIVVPAGTTRAQITIQVASGTPTSAFAFGVKRLSLRQLNP